ncbi:hypothetical protein [Nonomuraea sp. NPDC050783]|uniref:hypothetical protein n=1 Tax=Nonomuraea sp. NPDC050783 TaxID=3154634 RepID=UPI003465CDC2
MWIAVAVPVAVVMGIVLWWLRRDRAGTGGGGGGFAAGRPSGWRLGLAPEAEAAFMEGLGAHHDAGEELRPDWERGVLWAGSPPRLISLRLLADGFAALGEAALHDPQGAVAGLMAEHAATERPGVLHLRAAPATAAGWPADGVDGVNGLDGPDGPDGPDGLDGVDGLDRAAFAQAALEAACPAGTRGVEGHAADGWLQLTVTPLPTEESPVDAGSSGEGTGGDPGPGGERSGGAGRPGERLAAGAGSSGEKGRGDAGRGGEGAVAVAARGNTLLLDLGRVLELYLEAREKRPEAAVGELLREVVHGVVAADGPGLTWVWPPTEEERRAVLAARAAEPR